VGLPDRLHGVRFQHGGDPCRAESADWLARPSLKTRASPGFFSPAASSRSQSRTALSRVVETGTTRVFLLFVVAPRRTINCRFSSMVMWDNRADVKIRDIVKLLEDDGWLVVRQRGSHRQFKHANKPGLVTVAGKPSDDLAPGTLNSILKQAGLKP
jgi:predicted RNA binding protein YcfA (HicA-like mRNA interferase family)